MTEQSITRGRLGAVSGGVVALILVLTPRAPHDATIGALVGLWLAAISCLFKAILWASNRYLAPLAALAIKRLDRASFQYLFRLSLLVLSTAWIAPATLEAVPIVSCTAVFILISAKHLPLYRETAGRWRPCKVAHRVRSNMRRGLLLMLAVIAAAGDRDATSDCRRSENVSLGARCPGQETLRAARQLNQSP
jgi:uncharacterized membrane protein